jgi:lactoylglutathione lyase
MEKINKIIRGFNMKVKNVAIAVENMEESTKFYTEILGLKEVRRFSPQPGLTIALFKGEGEAMIELIENETEKKGLFLVGLEVEDMDAEVANLKAKGIELTRGPLGPPGGPRVAFLDGPDGVELEMIENMDNI